jgi:DNA-binding PadR family transcriptional regulator
MSGTRMLMLGAVRIFQPVHGYFVRRELLSWRADQWANLNPGSVYNALARLTKEGYLHSEDPGDGKLRYSLTAEGEAEFINLVREALWRVDSFGPSDLMAALGFSGALTREEVIAAMEGRIDQLKSITGETKFRGQTVIADPDTPDIVIEQFHFTGELQEAQRRFAEAFAQRVRDGGYVFAGEREA